MRHVSEKKEILKVNWLETKDVSQILQKLLLFFFFFNKLLLLSSSKQNQAPRSHQVSAGIVHLTAFCHGGLCWSGLNRGASDNYKTTLISKADTVSNCTDMTINPETTGWVSEEIISISTPGFGNSTPVKCTISRTIDFFFFLRKWNFLTLDWNLCYHYNYLNLWGYFLLQHN